MKPIRVPAALLILLLIGAKAVPASDVTFHNSCDARIQERFKEAITLLHSFEYPATTRLFRELEAADPDCAMARWGSAMSLWHPLWAPPTASALEAGRSLLAATDAMPKTPREAAYIEALKAFFSSSDTTTHRARSRAYEHKMADVYAHHLDDPEAAVFYALALLGAADPTDKSYARQFRATGLLNWVRQSQPQHPGVLHYIIHSYDYPGLAHLALDAAMTYAGAAPDSAHAQHMPSHIFTRLGLWEHSISSNHDSTRSAAAFTKSADLPGHYDEGLHSIDYLMYALLQTARDGEALDLLQQLAAIKRTDTENFKVAYTYAAAPARYALERRRWGEASALELVRKDFAWEDFGWARSMHFFARGIGAARAGNAAGAREELTRIRQIRATLPDTTLPYWREEVQVHADAVASWIAFNEGDIDTAVRLARAAAEREDSVDKHPVTPGEIIPARELLADLLFEAGRFKAALAEYETVLKSSPNRLNALVGAARSAAASGDEALSTRLRQTISQQVQQRGNDRPGLDELLALSPAS